MAIFDSIIINRISSWHSAGKIDKGSIENYITKYGRHESISSFFIKDSKPITFGSREQINQSVRSIERLYAKYTSNSKIKLPDETAYYILFDSFAAKIEYFKDTVSTSTYTNHSLINETFGFNRSKKIIDGKLIIGVIHTHPREVETWNGTKTRNKLIFDAQSGDFEQVVRMYIPLYSIGITEIDYYSSKGKGQSKNGLCSNDAFISGQFNLLKHAFVEYANTF